MGVLHRKRDLVLVLTFFNLQSVLRVQSDSLNSSQESLDNVKYLSSNSTNPQGEQFIETTQNTYDETTENVITALNSTIISKGISMDAENNTSKPFRLPTSLIPIHYKLEILPVLDELPIEFESIENSTNGFNSRMYEKFKALGRIWIKVVCTQNTNNVTLHASDIDINNSSIKVIKLSNNNLESIKEFQVDNDTDFFIILLEKEAVKGEQYEIYIEFVSRIADDRLNGLYSDYYIEKSTLQKRFLATTLFAPFHARKAFPCFDEPALRATFDIIVGRSEKYHSLSNAEIIGTQPMSNIPGWYWDFFNTTLKISTYVVAFIVSDFGFKENLQIGLENHTTDIRVFAPKHLIDSQAGDYGVNITTEILTEFENYFQFGFPMKKLYSVALPHFYFSAMENWGLITYKDPIILNMPNVTTETEKFNIAYVSSHEIAHQWFGNLVSVKWWTYVWLKEAFATFYGFHGINVVLPHFESWRQFTHKALQLALEFDGGPDTHPLDNEPINASSVADIYTRIPYEKGGSILRMTSNFLTNHTFQKAMRKYIQKMKYTSAEPKDAYEALQEAADEDGTFSANTTVKDVLETWTTQPGYPILRVIVANREQLTITQEKFVDNMTLANNDTDSASDGKNNYSGTWWIPVTISTAAEKTNDIIWMSKDDKSISLIIRTNQLILLNPHAMGFYRVLYDDILLLRFLYQLEINHKDIAVEARSQVLDDYFKMSFAGYVPISDAMLLTNYIGKEKDYSVWKTFFTNLEKPYKLLSSTNYFSSMKEYLTTKINSVMSIGVLENSSGLQRMLQSELFKWACRLDNTNCVEYSLLIMKKWQQHPQTNPIIADIQKTVYCTAAKSSSHGNNDNNTLWHFILDRYENELFSVQKDRMLYGLTCTKDPSLLLQILESTINNKIEMHDVDRVKIVQNIAENPNGRLLLLKFVDDNFKSLYKNISTANPVTESLKALSSYFNSPEEQNLIEAFIKNHETELDKKLKTVNKYVMTIKQNIKWVEDFGGSIHKWMEAKIATETNCVPRAINC